jgi:hypothetical protein
MTEQYFRDRYNTSNSFEGTDKEANKPVVNSGPFVDKTQVDSALVHETPMGGTVAAVGPMNEPLTEATPMFETPIQETPMGGAVAAVVPMNETPVHEAQIGETITSYMAPAGEVITEETQVSKSILYTAPVAETIAHETPVVANPGSPAALLNHEESEHFRTRWNEIQGKFVDEPRTAVQQADALVSEVIEQITQMFAKEHSSLDSQWNQGNDVSTEDLRKALQHYRSFFNRLVV